MKAVRTIFVLFLAFGMPGNGQAGGSQSSPGVRHALLVGCTKYRELPGHDLVGPGNDVLLVDNILRNKYHFDPNNIIILSEGEGEKDETRLPTRRNIERQFKRLANAVHEGDRVLILLSGHGSRQPDAKPDDPHRFKPDGLEEIFLPVDVAPAGTKRGVVNAIEDWEFRDWLADIRKQRASVWVIVDTCHSASMIRGSEDEVARDVSPEDLGLKEVNRAAEERTRKRNAGRAKVDK